MANRQSKPVHITPRNGGDDWAVIRQGNERATRVFDTQRQAAEYGRQIAREEHTELFLHRQNGQIRQRDSYGNDPFPPRDKD